MPKTTISPFEPSQSEKMASVPLAARRSVNTPRAAAQLDAQRLAVPVAAVRDIVPSPGSGMMREVFVTLPGAPLGSRVFLESRSASGPSQRIRALELPFEAARGAREFRALVPVAAPGVETSFVPIAVVDGAELRGREFRADLPRSQAFERGAQSIGAPPPETDSAEGKGSPGLPFPKLELLAHVQADLPKFSVFGATPEGLRIAFYITDGNWAGPLIHARYKSEGGDWIIVRRDGVAVPNARATLETSDGALLYYELTGTIDLGPDGYARSLANDFPDFAALAIVARISTSSERWNWLNRLTLVGTGVVNLKIGHTRYDLYSVQLDPAGLPR